MHICYQEVMRCAVIDTNVFVSAIMAPAGAPGMSCDWPCGGSLFRRARPSVTTHTSPGGPRSATILTCSSSCAWFGVLMSSPGCVRLTDVSVVGESPTERKGSHHFHREPCACHREVSGEASVAACAGQAIEPRNRLCRMRRDFPGNRRQHFSAAFG